MILTCKSDGGLQLFQCHYQQGNRANASIHYQYQLHRSHEMIVYSPLPPLGLFSMGGKAGPSKLEELYKNKIYVSMALHHILSTWQQMGGGWKSLKVDKRGAVMSGGGVGSYYMACSVRILRRVCRQ